MTSKRPLWGSLLLVGLCGCQIGCASIVHGTRQDVLITSTPPDAKALIYRVKTPLPSEPSEPGVSDAAEAQKRVLYTQTVTPATVSLERDHHYAVVFQKDGYARQQQPLTSVVDGWIAGNIVFGGLIGLTIDFATGAAYHLSPTPVDAVLEAHQDTPPAAGTPQASRVPEPDIAVLAAVRVAAPAPVSAPMTPAVMPVSSAPEALVPMVRDGSVRLQQRFDAACMYLQPTTEAKRLSRVASGVSLRVVEDRGAWLYIQTPDERRGWILQEWIAH